MHAQPTSRPLADLSYFRSLVDEFGIWQHSAGPTIDSIHGYALDDAARGLIVAYLRNEQTTVSELAQFIARSEVTGDGRLAGFASEERYFFDGLASEDATAQSYWALALSQQMPKLTSRLALHMPEINSLIPQAYALLGALLDNHSLAEQIAAKLAARFAGRTTDWYWPDEIITYGSGIVAYALCVAGAALKNPSYLAVGMELLDFLNQLTKKDDIQIPIGNDGWAKRGTPPAQYAQQPIEAGYMVLANVAVAEITGHTAYDQYAERWYSWFTGNNSAQQKLIDDHGRCYDGVESPTHISQNSGAESVIVYLLADYAIVHTALFGVKLTAGMH